MEDTSSSQDLTLYIGNKAYSSWSLRPWLCLTYFGIDFTEEVIPLYEDGSKEKILALSPAGKVPILRHGDIIVWDSMSILEYLAESFSDYPFWPQDRHRRAHARAVSNEMHSAFQTLRQTLPTNFRSRLEPRPQTPALRADIERISEIWRTCRQDYDRDGPFLFGTFSIADAMFAPVASRFHTYRVTLPKEAERYNTTVLELPAMRAWMADAVTEPWHIEKWDH